MKISNFMQMALKMSKLKYRSRDHNLKTVKTPITPSNYLFCISLQILNLICTRAGRAAGQTGPGLGCGKSKSVAGRAEKI